MALLEVKDLSVAFGDNLAADGVSFEIEKGETLALVGESGSGKSVSALSILKLLPYPLASHPSGRITFDGQEMLAASDNDLRKIRGRRVSMIFQEPMTSLNPLHTIGKQIAEVLQLHEGLTDTPARERVLTLLDQVGIKDPPQKIDSYPHQLSGGQRQRAMVAMALACKPDLLIADEPTTALDVTVQAQILELLKQLQDDLGMAMLIISHDLGIVRHVADRVAVMTDGKIVEQGPVAQVFEQPQHDYTKHLLAAEPKGLPHQPHDDAETIVSTDNLKVWFPIKQGFLRKVTGHVKAVDGISLSVRSGETLGVVGESGSGKTTLGMALLRLISSEGPITFASNRIDGLPSKDLRDRRADMQIVFQDPFGALSPRMSVADIIGEGLEIHEPQLSTDDRRKKVEAILEEVGLSADSAQRYPHEFSGGQRQRIAIARAMVLEPKLVILDEPTSALDMSVQAQIVDLLRRLQRDHDLAYIFISHDLKVVRALADQLIVMKDGKVVEQGHADQLFASPQTAYTKALMAAAFDHKAA